MNRVLTDLVQGINRFRNSSLAASIIVSMVLYGIAGFLVAVIASIFSALGVVPVLVVSEFVHSTLSPIGINSYQPPVSWMILFAGMFIVLYIYQRWLQPKMAIYAWIRDDNNFIPHYGKRPVGLDEYLARHPNALKRRQFIN